MDSGETVERIRRRQLIVLLCSFGLPVVVLFGIIDFLEGDRLEFAADLALIAILVAALIVIFRYNRDRLAYRIGLNLLALAVLYNVAIGAGKESALYWVYVLPLLLFFFQGRKDGLISVCAATLLLGLLMFLPEFVRAYDYGTQTGFRFFISFLFVAVIAYGLESSRHRFSDMLRQEHQALLEEKANLEQALGQIKTLRGMLPICSNCKKVRDDRGYWKQIESYVHEHSDAKFSHGICPDCARVLYPQVKIYDDADEEIGNPP
jgi:hypothetical protein